MSICAWHGLTTWELQGSVFFDMVSLQLHTVCTFACIGAPSSCLHLYFYLPVFICLYFYISMILYFYNFILLQFDISIFLHVAVTPYLYNSMLLDFYNSISLYPYISQYSYIPVEL